VSLPLHSCPHFTVTWDGPSRLVTLTRTPTPFATLPEVDPCLTRVNAALADITRTDSAILIDTRQGPVRNDPCFEDAFAPGRKRILAGFARAAVLVRTATGRLQAQRYTRDDRLEGVRIFDDEHLALAYLTAKSR